MIYSTIDSRCDQPLSHHKGVDVEQSYLLRWLMSRVAVIAKNRTYGCEVLY